MGFCRESTQVQSSSKFLAPHQIVIDLKQVKKWYFIVKSSGLCLFRIKFIYPVHISLFIYSVGLVQLHWIAKWNGKPGKKAKGQISKSKRRPKATRSIRQWTIRSLVMAIWSWNLSKPQKSWELRRVYMQTRKFLVEKVKRGRKRSTMTSQLRFCLQQAIFVRAMSRPTKWPTWNRWRS